MDTDIQQKSVEIKDEFQPLFGYRKACSNTLEFTDEPASKIAIAITTVDGKSFSVGDAKERFSIGSISMVFTLTLAMQKLGDGL